MSELFNRTGIAADTGFSAYLVKVFTKMGLGLAVTAAVAALSYFTGFFMTFLQTTGMLGYLLLIAAQFGIVIALSSRLTTMSTTKANLLFFAYSAITGFTFTTVLYAYSTATVFGAFAFSAVLFFSCAVIGAVTDVDLSKFSSLIMGGLIALIVASVVSMFIPALRNSLLLSYVGIIIFLVLTAWDMQKIRMLYNQTAGYGTAGENMAVFGAFELYLDFINIFLYVLRILGSRSSRD